MEETSQNEFDNDTERTVSIRRDDITVDIAYLKCEREMILASYDVFGELLQRLTLSAQEIQALVRLFSSPAFA